MIGKIELPTRIPEQWGIKLAARNVYFGNGSIVKPFASFVLTLVTMAGVTASAWLDQA